MNANGSSSQSLTGSLGYLQHSVWSPDGTSIAFDGDINNDFWSDLSIYNLLDHSQKVVKRTNRGVDILLGGWSADGQWLLVSRAFYALQNYQWVLDAARVVAILSMALISRSLIHFDMPCSRIGKPLTGCRLLHS